MREGFKSLHQDLISSQLTARQSHRTTLAKLCPELAQHKSNLTCLCCLMRQPEKVLTCGHSICDVCIRIFGTSLKKQRYNYLLTCCLLCRSTGDVRRFQYQAPTTGPRLLSLDGGGVRGVIPLAFLQTIEEELRLDCPIQQLFDFVGGTSAGLSSYLVCRS